MSKLFDIIFEEEKNIIVRQYEDHCILFSRKYNPKISSIDLSINAIEFYRRYCYEEAIIQIESAISIDQNNYFNWIIRANILEENQKYLEAIESYKIAIFLSKEVWYSFLYQIGICYLLSGNFLRAKNFILLSIRVKKLTINGENVSSKFKVKNEGEFIDGCVINIPQSKMIANLGSCYYNLNETDEAVKILREAIILEPTYHMPYCLIGLLLIKNNKPEESKKFLLKAHKLGNPNALKILQNNNLI